MLAGSHVTFLAMSTALASSAVVTTVPPPPVAPAVTRTLQRWLPGPVRCGALTLPATAIRRAYTSLHYGTAAVPSRAYRFRLDAKGMPFSITGPAANYDASVSDIAPSLASTRFTVPGPQDACEVTYSSDIVTIADAPLGDLISYSITPQSGALPEAGWARIKPAGGDCDRQPRVGWLRAVSPDYTRLGGEPGVRDWSLVGYDLDAKGRPTGVHMVEGTRNAVLDRAAVTAMEESRQTEGPRHGCLNPFVRNATRLPAPVDVDLGTLRPSDATCPEKTPSETTPTLAYPDSWRRRAIEGWAVIAYDVAPWGGVGNVRVLAAEPSSEFGEAATRIIAAAKKQASPRGYTGCIERVRYIMGPGTPEPASPPRAALSS